MKKLYTYLIILFTSIGAFGQNTLPATGNVGIGTSTPTFPLHVLNATRSQILVSGYSYNSTTQSTANGEIAIGATPTFQGLIAYNGQTNANLTFRNTYNVSDNLTGGFDFVNGANLNLLRISSNGNVVIGTSSPLTKLTIANAFTPTYMQLAIKNVTAGEGIGISLNESNNTRRGYIYAANGNGLILGDETGYGIRAFSGASEIFTARSNGNIGIGTVNPQNKLEITGALNSSGLRFTNLKSTTTVSPSNNKALSVDANGDVILVNSGVNDAILSSSNKTIVGIEKNMLFNAKSRFTVTQTGTAKLDENTIFDGAFTPSYTTVGIPAGDSTVVLIENLPNVHTQLGALVGWTTRYWWPVKFKIEGYNTFGTAGWVQIANISNNSNSEYFIKPPSGQYTKLRYTFYTAAGDQGKLGISELIYQHPEYVKAYDGLMVQYNETGKVGIGTNAPEQKLDVSGNIRVSGGLMRPDNAGFALQLGNGTNNIFGNTAFYDIVGTNQRMLITETGNVGIGTKNPQKKLEVLVPSNDFASVGVSTFGPGAFSGIHFGYREDNNLYRKSAIVFERTDLTSPNAQGKIHLLNGPQAGAGNATLADAKFTINESGNVGIGTTNPIEKLSVYGVNNSMPGTILLQSSREDAQNVAVGSIKAMNGNGEVARIDLNREGGSSTGYINFFTKATNSTPVFEAMRISANGKIGIGTSTPNANLEVIKNLRISSNTTGYGYEFIRSNDDTKLELLYMANNVIHRKIMTYGYNGEVGIGDAEIPIGYKLAVAGNIIADKIKVKKSINGAWPDFVFKKEYQLPSLSDIEKYVNQNSHLPEIPSAAEVEKDGQDLGEMNRLLLKKVEELTLYLIQQEKKNKEQDILIQKLLKQ